MRSEDNPFKLIDEPEPVPYQPTPKEVYNEWVDYLLYQKLMWAKQAACRNLSPAKMYRPYQTQQRVVAEKVCSKCPVKVACLALAIANDDHDGVWGGFCETDRQIISESIWNKLERYVAWNDDKIETFYREIRSYTTGQTIPISHISNNNTNTFENTKSE